MKLRKLMALAACAAMTFTMTACGSNDSDKDTSDAGKKEITVWAWDETFNIKAMEDAKEMYAKDHKDAKINIVTMSQDDIVQKLNTSLSSGKTDGLPNIVLIEDYRIQGYLTSYPDAFKDLSGIVKEEDFMDYKFAVNKVDDKIYGVPFDSGVAALFYRSDILEKAGYSAKDMENLTWEKYIEIGKDVKEKTGVSMLTLDPSDLGQIRMMLQSAGSWYLKEDGQTVNLADNTQLKEAITIYKDMIESGMVKQIADWDSFVSAFQKGEVASVPSGCWIGSSIMKAEDLKGKWAVTQIPRMGKDDKSINASSIGGGGWYVLNGIDGTDTAVDFLKETFASSKDLANTLVKDISLVSTLKSAADTENYKAPSEYFSGQKIYEDLSNWSTKVPAVNYGLHTYTIEDILTESVQAIVNGADMDATLKDAQTQAEGAVAN